MTTKHMHRHRVTSREEESDEVTTFAGSTAGADRVSPKTEACSIDDAATTEIATAATSATSTYSKKKKRGRQPGPKNKEKSVKKKKSNKNIKSFIDLTGVPPQPLLLKNDLSSRTANITDYKDNTRRRPVKEGISSKYTGVYFDKTYGKWKAQMMVNGTVRSIGHYDKEEEAASDYARAAFKYKATKGGSDMYAGLDLGSIPEQPLITSDSASGYKGVKKMRGRFQARISVEQDTKTLGTFDDAEEAAGIYARAACYLEQKQESSWEIII